MKHLKRFNESYATVLFYGFSAMALVKMIYNVHKKSSVGAFSNQESLSDDGFEKLIELTRSYRNRKKLIGEIIDRDDYAQVIYKYGGGDNTITIQLYKTEKRLVFKWDFDMPFFPFIKYSDESTSEVDLTDIEVGIIEGIIDEIKNEKRV